MNKPYLLIAGDNQYPSGDTGDWIGCFSTYDEAQDQIVKKTKGYNIKCRSFDWYEIVDLREWCE